MRDKIEQLKIDAWLRVQAEGRRLRLILDKAAVEEVSRLDGCYVIKTDLSGQAASKQVVHDCYKDVRRQLLFPVGDN